ncbi:MAG: UvrD-helicase domain-containing protein [Alphaproteobacteria bacterium]|nr:UvrD-helicase domain-containing protein [Alphaproteobacteria bacterium]
MSKRGLSYEQNKASDPTLNVWVQANAGTGKTSVLVQRLLRILFRRDPDMGGILCLTYTNAGASDNESASRKASAVAQSAMRTNAASLPGILCLTYTNAGASEMRNRILAALREWAMSDDDTLRGVLTGIAYNQVPTDEDLAHARQIFYAYIDNPDILKIKTIHGFCEEILRRFPCEAGIAPAWGLISDANQKRLLNDAFHALINSDAGQAVSDAFAQIVGRVSEHSLDDLLDILTGRYRQFFQVENFINYRQQFLDTAKEFLELDMPVQTEISAQNLQKIIKCTEDDMKSSKKPAGYLLNIVNLTKQFIDKSIDFEEYQKAYLTATDSKIVNVAKKDYLAAEQDRVYSLNQRNMNLQIFKDTVALFDLSAAFAQKYKELKAGRNLLDFEDLILYTRNLFSKPDAMGWVLSQLDLSLHHILVDEAQDTSPPQWDILKALSSDFFTDGSQAENPRALFVVGDTKQSIYGFQGADPNAFAESKDAISAQIKNNLRAIQEIPLEQSFRSAGAILRTVDYFFGILPGFAAGDHKVFRIDAPGLVELHPLSASEEKSALARREYIKKIADEIESQVANGAPPGDIMVLVQRRAPFVPPLVNELKKREIPVAGSDRIILPEFPAIRDLMNLTRFCIDPMDDYSLACVLKSPLFRLSESGLYALCNNRGDASIYDILRERHPEIHSQLSEISEWSRTLAPYSFFMRLLNTNNRREKMIAALGAQIVEPLEEFLTICLSYERTQPGALRHFLKWFTEGGSEIKRELSAATGVRITTVHGSKGLEAPIVFLIDTIRTPRDKPEKVVPITSGRSLDVARQREDGWLWSPKSTNSERWTAAANVDMDNKMAEYWRLLYVAMTRARDKLFIHGFCTTKSPPVDAWHTRLWEALQSMPEAVCNEDAIRISNE